MGGRVCRAWVCGGGFVIRGALSLSYKVVVS